MRGISIQQPAELFDDDQKDYLVRQFVQIDLAFGNTNYYPPRGTIPSKVKIGEVFYFSSAIPTTAITGEGLWIYKSTGWTLIA